MRLIKQILGLGLVLLGLYFLGQNIFFSTWGYGSWWGGVAASGSVLLLMGEVLCLVFLRGDGQTFGWFLLGLGIILVFFSGQVVLRPTNLWQFVLAFTALASGSKLLNTRSSLF